MKITLNKEYTEKYMEARTREQMKEFKQMFTDNDLFCMFDAAIGDAADLSYNPDIIRCDLSAYPGGTMQTDETHYFVDMLLKGFDEFITVHFCMSQSGEITLKAWDIFSREYVNLWEVKHYKLSN